MPAPDQRCGRSATFDSPPGACGDAGKGGLARRGFGFDEGAGLLGAPTATRAGFAGTLEPHPKATKTHVDATRRKARIFPHTPPGARGCQPLASRRRRFRATRMSRVCARLVTRFMEISWRWILEASEECCGHDALRFATPPQLRCTGHKTRAGIWSTEASSNGPNGTRNLA